MINTNLYKRQDDAKVPVMTISDKEKKTKDVTKIYSDRKKGELFQILRKDYEHDQGQDYCKKLTLAYTNTIHCFQGKTLSKGKLYIIIDNLFEKAMFYVLYLVS